MTIFDGTKERISASYSSSQVRLGKLLHARGAIGDAFRLLCKKGCAPRQLQDDLFKLSRYPQWKLEKEWKAKDLLKLRAIATKVKKAAEELRPFEDLLFQENFAGINFQRRFLDWERPTEIPNTLRRLSDRLSQCSDWAKLSPRSFPNVYERIPAIVEYVRTATGRPYYEELATLIGATLRDAAFNVEQLKMICARRKSKAKK